MKPKLNLGGSLIEIPTAPFMQEKDLECHCHDGPHKSTTKDSIILVCCFAFLAIVCFILLVKSRAWFI